MTNVNEAPETRRIEASDRRSSPDAPPAPDTRPAAEANSTTPVSQSRARAHHRSSLRRTVALGSVLLALALAGAVIEALVKPAFGRADPIAWLTLTGVILLATALMLAGLNEIRALTRLRRLESLRERAHAVLQGDSVDDPGLVKTLSELHNARPELKPALQRFRTNAEGVGDTANQITAFDAMVLADLDTRVERVTVAAVRRSITATAVSPFPLLDAAFTAWTNLRVVRDIAVINGGRPGTLATLGLIRKAFFSVLAAGVFESAQDAVHDVVGGGLAGRLSTTMATAVTNGLLTARLAVTAADVCRPVPRSTRDRPNARQLLGRALSDSFTGSPDRASDGNTQND